MSDFLVHLVPDLLGLETILANECVGEFENPLGALYGHSAAKAKRHDVVPNQHSCCLSEIPLDLLDRLAARHGSHGVVISRSYAQSSGAVRVWYLDAGTPIGQHFFDWVGEKSFGVPWRKMSKDDPLWAITPFVDQVTDGSLTHRRREFDWEREWRVVGGLALPKTQVAMVFAPESDHAALQTHGILSADLTWPEDKLQSVFEDLPLFE